MRLLDTRDVYRPFQYPQFEDYHRKLYTSFWHPNEVSLDEDINDFKLKLTENEKAVVSRTLKNFVQSEIHIGCYWGDFVSSWFKHPEIQNVARYISGNESIHAVGYDLLNTSLGLDDYESLKKDKALYARIKTLMNKKAKSEKEILKQIFVYSVMGEGVCLFSSFITLFAFTKKNLLKGIGQIISWSSLDEQFHSDIGCELFNIFKKEYNLFDDELKEELYALSREIVEMEYNLVDRIFENIEVDFINKDDIKNFVNDKANKQLKKVGLNKIFKVDKNRLNNTSFFDIMINGESVIDFFSSKTTEYSKGILVFDEKVWSNK